MRVKKPLNIAVFLLVLFSFTVAAFAQGDLPRRTTAVTYPLDEEIRMIFRGTTRFPRMKGKAKIKRSKKNGTEIELTVSKMPRPFELGAGYATYVLWAISPNGQIDNLGEIKRRGFFEFDSKISVTTPLQTFALVVTAEPHFLVTRPSKEIMLENLRPYSTNGNSVSTTTAVEYFGNSSDYFQDPRAPEIAEVNYRRTPTSILQAQQAIALAKYAGAERDAPDELKRAVAAMNNADNGWKAGRSEEYVDIEARKAVSIAVQAESTTNARKDARDKRNIKLRQDAELRDSEKKYDRAQDEIEGLKTALANETRSRELSERDAQNYLDQIRELKNENATLREQLEESRIRISTIEAKQNEYEAEKARAIKLKRLEAKSGVMVASLKGFGAVTKSDGVISVTLADTYWSGVRVSSFSANGDTKTNGLAQVLANAGDYRFEIAAYSDNKGVPAELKLLTEERAQAIADRIFVLGVPNERIEVKGYGATDPKRPNSTRANRSKNRRVLIHLIPNI